MVQRLLSSADFKMDPMVSLYYYAPACAAINGVITLFVEIPKMTMTDIYDLGLLALVANAFVAFLLNVAVVLLVCTTTLAYVLRTDSCPDRQDLCCRLNIVGCLEGYSLGYGINGYIW